MKKLKEQCWKITPRTDLCNEDQQAAMRAHKNAVPRTIDDTMHYRLKRQLCRSKMNPPEVRRYLGKRSRTGLKGTREVLTSSKIARMPSPLSPWARFIRRLGF